MTLLDYLAHKAKLSGDIFISFDELEKWPAEQVEQAKQLCCLVQTDDAEEIICDKCHKHCPKEVEIREKDGQSVGVYFCEDEDCAGLIQIDLKRLQQWQIDKKKLARLGYGSKKGEKGECQNRQEKKQNEILILHAALLKHHGFGEKNFNYEPATQKILKSTGWGQSKIHRTMEAIFGHNPMSAYKAKCKNGTIIGFLKKNEEGNSALEAIAHQNEE